MTKYEYCRGKFFDAKKNKFEFCRMRETCLLYRNLLKFKYDTGTENVDDDKIKTFDKISCFRKCWSFKQYTF